MKRVLIFSVLLALVACAPPPVTLVPVNTLVALTMAAMPKTETPTTAPLPTATPTPPPTNTPIFGEISSQAPGAQCIPSDTERTRALVTRVLDAQTIEAAIGNDTFRIRYIGVDAPGIIQTVEWQGPQAIAYNERLVGGQIVVLVKDISETNPEGELLRYVLTGNVFVNYEMIRQGYAKALVTPPDVACQNIFLVAQTEAQAGVIGVWAPTPLPTPTITLTPTSTPLPTVTQLPPCGCQAGLSCNSFATHEDAQACYDYCTSIGKHTNLVDKNGNGKVCEGLP